MKAFFDFTDPSPDTHTAQICSPKSQTTTWDSCKNWYLKGKTMRGGPRIGTFTGGWLDVWTTRWGCVYVWGGIGADKKWLCASGKRCFGSRIIMHFSGAEPRVILIFPKCARAWANPGFPRIHRCIVSVDQSTIWHLIILSLPSQQTLCLQHLTKSSDTLHSREQTMRVGLKEGYHRGR